MSNPNKYVYSTFSIYHFDENDFIEDEFDREAKENASAAAQKNIYELFYEMKSHFDATEKALNNIRAKNKDNEVNTFLTNFEQSYLKLVNTFANLEIEVNRLYGRSK